MKTCRGCGRSLPQDMFWRRDRSPDGLQYRCKDCQRPGYAKRESERKRAERARRAREWRERNPERVRAYRAAYAPQARVRRFLARVERLLAEAHTVASLYAESTGSAAPSPVSASDLVEHWRQTGVPGRCSCGRPWAEITHRTPLYSGGEHAVGNLIPLCEKEHR